MNSAFSKPATDIRSISLYYERHGNPAGAPVVCLHGGPGGGSTFNEYRLFDPDHFNVLIFDQRGSGKSHPYASIENNSIAHLTDDIDRLRRHFGHEKWSIAGGSWGSALTMFYAAKYPQHVVRMLLRGIFFADRRGADYLIEEDGAAKTCRNAFFDDYQNFIPATERAIGLKQAYYNRVTSDDKETALRAALLFKLWDISIATLIPRQDWLDKARRDLESNLALSRIFFHFTMHEYDDDHREYLINRMAESGIPLDIIHGQRDDICPLENAEDLHRRCPGSTLDTPSQCGHSQLEEPLLESFLKITHRWMRNDKDSILTPSPSGRWPG